MVVMDPVSDVPTCANQRLKGSAFFEGIDCTNRNTLSKSYIWQSAVSHL